MTHPGSCKLVTLNEAKAVIASDRPLTDDDAFWNWLVGFIEGEGCFDIRPHHRLSDGTRTYACDFLLGLRDDDEEILLECQRRTGLGMVQRATRPASAKVPGHDLSIWRVWRKDDCIELARMLDGCQFHTRKVAQYRVWREALSAWSIVRHGATHANASGPWRAMAQASKKIRKLRDYTGEVRIANAAALVPNDDSFGYWLAGLADAEGTFGIRMTGTSSRYHRGAYSCYFRLVLRADDAGALVTSQAWTGVGRVRPRKQQRIGCARPQAEWAVENKREAATLCRFFRRFPLRTKKRNDFEIWRRAVAVCHEVRHCGAALAQADVRPLLVSLKQTLENGRMYPADDISISELDKLQNRVGQGVLLAVS